MKLICPDCGMQYDSGKFCLECGAKLQEIAPELVCPSCGTKVKSGKFCPECGTKLTEQSDVPSNSTSDKSKITVAERKFNERDPRLAKYYDKKRFPREISPEERAVAIEELTTYSKEESAEAKMLLANILIKEDPETAFKLFKEAEEGGDKLAFYMLGVVYMYCLDESITGIHDLSEAEKRMIEMYQEYQNGNSAEPLAELYAYSEEKCDYKKAFEFATIAAEEDEMSGYEVLGALYLHGWGVDQNTQLALENYKMAAALGDATAMNQIGYIFMGNEGVEPNPEQTFYWYNEAAKKNSDIGMYNLGYCYKNGFGVETDVEKAAEWFKKAADAGYVDAIYELGAYYQEVLIDFDKAKTWYLKAAEMGYAEGQNKLGVLYSNAFNDSKEAIKWYKKAMEQDYPWAYRNYAWCLWNGDGVKSNKKKALEMMQKAIELGLPEGEKELQEMQGGNVDEAIDKAKENFQNGKLKEAVAAYKKYAEIGNPRAMANLGLCMLEGSGISQNLKVGIEWLTKAAEAGNPFACCRLVEIYSGSNFKGKTVKADIKLAKKFLELAKKVGADENEIKMLEEQFIPFVEFSNIRLRTGITQNNLLGFQVSGKLLINGLIGENLEFSAFCVNQYRKKACLSMPKNCIEKKYSTNLIPDYVSTVWENFSFFIPYKNILNTQDEKDEYLCIVVWHKDGKENTKLLEIEQPYHIRCITHILRSDEYFFYFKNKK